MSDNNKGVAALNMVTALINDLSRNDPDLKERLKRNILLNFKDIPLEWKQEQLEIIMKRLE